MFKIDHLARKAIKLSALMLLSGQLMAQLPNNATTPRNWALLLTEKAPNSYGTPTITRTSGTATSACLDNTNDIQAQASFTVSVPGLSNPVYTWSTVGGLTIVGATTGSNVTVKPVKDASGKYLPGKLLVDYSGTTSKVERVYFVCNGTSSYVDYTVLTTQKGQAFVNLVQKFTHTYPIVGPVCVSLGENVTYSIAPLVSSYEARDGYKWEQVASGAGLSVPTVSTYNSLDGSSITGTISTIPTSLSVYVGACNQAASDKKTILFATKMPQPAAQVAVSGNIQASKTPCVDYSVSQVTFSVKNPNASLIDYLWSWDNAGFSLASGSLTGTSITLNIGGSTGKVYLRATPKPQSAVPAGSTAYCSSNNSPLFDEITINRGYTTSSITGPAGTPAVTCVKIGQTYTYAATANGQAIGTKVNWTLPAGMVFEPASPVQTTSTITVKVVSTVATGSGITGTVVTEPGMCGGTINGLYNLTTAPSITSLAGPNPSATAGIFCAAPSTNPVYTATAANYDNLTWSSTGGITGGGSTAYNASIPAGFTEGTLTVVASKFGCPNTDPKSITIKSSATLPAITSVVANKACLNNNIADQVTLTASPGYKSYTWSVPTGWSVVGANNTNVITYTTNGTGATVTVTGTTECSTTSPKSITLTANGVGQPVTITKSSVTGADILSAPYISDGAGNVATYEWFKNGSTTPFSNNFTVSLTVPTGVTNTYSVVVTYNSCKSKSTNNGTSTYSNARLEEGTEAQASLTLAPNPTHSEFIVQLTGLEGADVTIISQADGKSVKKFKATAAVTKVNAYEWASGVYTVVANHNGKQYTSSLVVQH